METDKRYKVGVIEKQNDDLIVHEAEDRVVTFIPQHSIAQIVNTDSDDDDIPDKYEDSDNDGVTEGTDYNGAYDTGETKPDSKYTDRDSLEDSQEVSSNFVVEDDYKNDPHIEVSSDIP